MVEYVETCLKDVLLIKGISFEDDRGSFTKLFSALKNDNSNFHLKEVYFNKSKKNVIRGMHFQDGEFALNKIITCIEGHIHDVILDIRPSSSTYKKIYVRELIPENNEALFIPKGVAHGFLSLKKYSKLLYFTDQIYSAEHDKGFLWNSFGCNWPCNNPNISDRDLSFERFE